MTLKLSVLDVLPTGAAVTATEALGRATALAQHVDGLGYERLWFAEHHGMPMIASAVPELLIAHVAPVTHHMRIGAGGVMLPNHAPLRVVEQYRTLNALHPGRIDLGIGRAAGTDPLTARALSPDPSQPFAQKLSELLAFDGGAFPRRHPFRRIKVTPQEVELPPIWMLGSSGGSATVAGELGTGYAFAGHFSNDPAAPAVELYKKAFAPSAHFEAPQVILALSVLCAEDPAIARAYCVILACEMQEMLTGIPAPIPDLEDALVLSENWSEEELRQGLGPIGHQVIYGSPDHVKGEIEARAAAAEADEIMLMTIIHDPEGRHASYSLLADAFSLTPPATPDTSAAAA